MTTRDAEDSLRNELDALDCILRLRPVKDMDHPMPPELAALVDDAATLRRRLDLPLLREGMEAYRRGRFEDALPLIGRVLRGDYDCPPLHDMVDTLLRNLPDSEDAPASLPPPFHRPASLPDELRVLFGIAALQHGRPKTGLAFLEGLRWDAILLGDTAGWVIDLADATDSPALRQAVMEGFSRNPSVLRGSNFQTQMSLAALAFRTGRQDIAREQYLRFSGLNRFPDACNLVRLVQGLVRTGSDAQALALLRRLEPLAVTDHPSDVFALLSLAEAHLAARGLEDARRVCRHIATQRFKDPDLVVRMANIFLQAGLLEDGLELAERALADEGLTPRMLPLLCTKGLLQGQSEDALARIEQEAARLQEPPPALTYWRLVLEERLGRQEAAWERLRALEDAGQLFSGLLFFFKAPLLLARGEPREAAAALESLIAHFTPPTVGIDWLWQIHFQTALLLLDLGEPGRARRLLGRAAEDYRLRDNACQEVLALLDCREAGRTPPEGLARGLEDRADHVVGEWLFCKPWLYLKAAQVHGLRGETARARRLVEEKLLPCPYFQPPERRLLRALLLEPEAMDFAANAQALAGAFFPHWPAATGWAPVLAGDILRDAAPPGGRP